ncbi:MAG: hypothetical protein QXW52_08505 [Candidatus Caldarchaeum sp.]
MLSVLLVLSMLLSSLFYVNQAPPHFWLVGLGGEEMLPLLDGGVLTARVGESLAVRLMGRDGRLNVFSPQGDVRETFIRDGLLTVLKKFTVDDVGEWVVETDEGARLTIVVEDPQLKPPVSLNVWIENTTVVATVATSPNAFALFMDGRGEDVYTPGSTLLMNIQGLNVQVVRFDLLKKADRIRYAGKLNQLQYTVELDQVVSSQFVQVRGGSVSLQIPAKDFSGPQGLRVLGYGQYVARLVATGDNRLIAEREITVVPERFRGFGGLSRSVRVDLHQAMSRNFTLVVGNELGDVRVLQLRLPVTVFNVYDRTHSQRIDRYQLFLENSSSQKTGDTTLLAFYNSLSIQDYENNTYLEPSRISTFTLAFDGHVVEYNNFKFSPGVPTTIDLNLYSLVLRLVYPNGSVHRGTRVVEVNGMAFRDLDERLFLLPPENYVIRALEPKSFAPVHYTLTSDTVLTIMVLENAEALASLRVSALFMALLIGYASFRLFRMRKTFYRARSG